MPKDPILFDILTLFPNFFSGPLSTSLTNKGIHANLIKVGVHDIRDFGSGKHRQVDDRPFGGGPGMVLKPDVLAKSLKNLVDKRSKLVKSKPHVVLLDAAGSLLKQEKAQSLAKKSWVILICGHYEGVDERFKNAFVDEEISIGDYILTGGEPAALVVLDSVSRLIPGFLGKKESVTSESFAKVRVENKELKLLDYPVYTRPDIFAGRKVPEVLLSGNHQKIGKWRLEKSLEKTKKKRPDLLREG